VDYLVDVGSDEFRKTHQSSLAGPAGISILNLGQHRTNIKRCANTRPNRTAFLFCRVRCRS
jgi:hypothetical protein